MVTHSLVSAERVLMVAWYDRVSDGGSALPQFMRSQHLLPCDSDAEESAKSAVGFGSRIVRARTARHIHEHTKGIPSWQR